MCIKVIVLFCLHIVSNYGQIVERYPDGGYHYFYETKNGISVAETGHLLMKESVIIVDGFFKFQSPEGQTFRVDYKADLNGFQPTGKHLPTPPPVPKLIQKSLQFNDIEKAKRQYHIPDVVLPLEQIKWPTNY